MCFLYQERYLQLYHTHFLEVLMNKSNYSLDAKQWYDEKNKSMLYHGGIAENKHTKKAIESECDRFVNTFKNKGKGLLFFFFVGGGS